MRLNFARLFSNALAPLILWNLCAAPAFARSIATTIEPAHGPVKITGCRAQLEPYTLQEGRPLVVWLDFRNSGTRTATAVRFYFRATDAFGVPIASTTGDRLGTFSSGVEIQNWQGSNAKAMIVQGTNVANVACRVEMVRFADGSEWRGNYAPPGLYYPPTPSPTESP